MSPLPVAANFVLRIELRNGSENWQPRRKSALCQGSIENGGLRPPSHRSDYVQTMPRAGINSHHCPVAPAAGGLIDRSWCFDTFAERLAGLPPITSAADILRSELLLAEDGPFSVRYCPFDYVNPQAKVVIVGITPGLHQMFLSCQEAQRTLADGPEGDDVLRRACDVGSFAGSMRTNLVTMLDGLALPEILGIASVAQLFGQRSDLLHSTSALIYPVFISGKNYSGSPDPLAFPLHVPSSTRS